MIINKELYISSLQKIPKGIYQCIVKKHYQTAEILGTIEIETERIILNYDLGVHFMRYIDFTGAVIFIWPHSVDTITIPFDKETVGEL